MPATDPATPVPSADTVGDWVDLVDRRYPEADAADWDASGLQVGRRDDPVRTVLVALDVTDAVLDEAADVDAELVLAHHPLLMRPLARLTGDTAASRLALRAARERVAILAAHTNLDVARPGTSDPIAEALGLRGVRPLVPLPTGAASAVKLVVFVPQADTAVVHAALSAAGAGRIGAYDGCGFRTTGTGTFRPSEAANPHIGERGERTEVTEDRLEMVVERRDLAAVLAALEEAHPYEEVAFDLLALQAPPTGKGTGVLGRLPEPLSLRTVADRLATGLDAPHLRVVGDLDRSIRTVAGSGGAGDSYIDAARRAGADVYVTGDLRHHPALDAATMGMALVDAGHWPTESAALPAAIADLTARAAEGGLAARLLASRVRTEPWAPYEPPVRAGG